MPNLANWEMCCGCGACTNKCQNLAITMQPNQEGFLHPVVDTDKCVECGACMRVCPGLSAAQNNEAKPSVFVVQHKDADIRFQSTSGGAFTAIAEEVIRRGGVAFGAVMTEGLIVRHECVTEIEGLAKFRNSKYVQSEIGDSYNQAKEFLNAGRYVCFSGTPCQMNGLYKYLDKDYENLIAVDVVCKSVPSPLIFRKYVEYKKQIEGDISDIVFRDKKRGFSYCTMAHYHSHEDRERSMSVYRRGSESDEWLRLFLSGKISRHSCVSCIYQTKHRVGDFTLGDIWETNNDKLDDNKGTTLMCVWTQKGRMFLDSIKGNIEIEAYPLEKARGTERTNTITIFPDREMLFNDADRMSAGLFFAKYAPYSLKVRVMQLGRFLIWRLHIHNSVRHFKHLVIHGKWKR